MRDREAEGLFCLIVQVSGLDSKLKYEKVPCDVFSRAANVWSFYCSKRRA